MEELGGVFFDGCCCRVLLGKGDLAQSKLNFGYPNNDPDDDRELSMGEGECAPKSSIVSAVIHSSSLTDARTNLVKQKSLSSCFARLERSESSYRCHCEELS